MENASAVYSEFVPYGLPGQIFDVVHGIAVSLLLVSICMSTGVLVYLRPGRSFFTWRIGDRIVVYMALCDLTYSIPVMVDHSYLLVTRAHAPKVACTVLAFFLNEAILSQAIVVVFASVNAYAMVVLSRKLETGTRDWRLLAVAFAVPAVLGIVGAALGVFGPSEAWCYIDVRKSYGAVMNTVVTVMMVITFLFTCVCYLRVWLRIRKSAEAAAAGVNKYHRTAKVMMVFVAAYILQWWGAVLYGMWGLFGEPHLLVIICTLVFATLGGLWNFVAYTLIRRRMQNLGVEVVPVDRVSR